MKRSIIFLVLLLSAFASDAQPQVSVHLRDIGYTLGDYIDARVHIKLDEGDALDPSTLPSPGPLNAWLDLKDVSLDRQGDAYDFYVRWQIFRTVEAAQKVRLPAIELKTMKQPAGLIVVPEQEIFLSPVLANPIEDSNPRSIITPPHFDLTVKSIRTLVLLSIFFSLLLIWLWLIDRLPGFPRAPKPLTVLARHLRAKRGTLTREDMQKVHATLNRIAGETLYPPTLTRLFSQAPYLISFRSEIENFFHLSWKNFFQSAEEMPDLASVQSWVYQSARAERMYRG